MFDRLIVCFLLLMISASASAKTHIIEQKDKKFSTTKLKIKLGDELIFKNQEDTIVHNVVSMTPGNEFDLQTQNPKSESTVKVDPAKHKVGKMTVECALHPEMVLEIEIEK